MGAPAVNTSGSQSTTVGTTEDSLATVTGAKLLQAVADINALASTEELEFALYGKARSTDTERQLWRQTASGRDLKKQIISPWFLSPHHFKFNILQRTGSSRAIPWAVYEAGTAAVNTSGAQSTTIGTTPDVLATITAAKALAVAVDINALATTEWMWLLLYGKARSSDTERLIERHILCGYDQNKLFVTPVYGSPHHFKVAILQESGSSRSIPWAVYEAS